MRAIKLCLPYLIVVVVYNSGVSQFFLNCNIWFCASLRVMESQLVRTAAARQRRDQQMDAEADFKHR